MLSKVGEAVVMKFSLSNLITLDFLLLHNHPQMFVVHDKHFYGQIVFVAPSRNRPEPSLTRHHPLNKRFAVQDKPALPPKLQANQNPL